VRRYQVAPQVEWCVEPWGLMVVDRASGASQSLHYPCAGVWDLMSRGYSFDHMARMVGAIAGIDAAHAEGLILDIVDEWVGAGLVIEVDGDG